VAVVAASLVEALGADAVVTDQDALLAYSYDATGERHWPDVVVLPRSADEAALTVELAYRYRAPIVGRGASTNLSGGTAPLVGGVVVSFARMNHIIEVDTSARWCRVEPGVVNADLAEHLKALGYFYPPDPASHRISTIGGNVAENSGGPHCVKYGVTTHHVVGLKVVLANGHAVELPAIGAAGESIDLGSLIIGSEGTLALVVEATLAIQPLPQGAATALAV
jgi:FAD/FMN-containing dehydrogenase